MSTVLNLIGEFSALSDQKVRCGGELDAAAEERWKDLKAFFNTLMLQPGLPLRTPAPFAASEIRRRLTERIRVPAEGYAIVRYEEGCLQARVVNLSRGGVFLGARNLLPIGAQPTLYLAGIDGNFENEVLESKGEVIWCTKRGIPEAALPRGMGLRFVDVIPETRNRLESLIAGSIETQLSGLW